MMITRLALDRLEQALRDFPVAGLIGPRQVGKTTLAHALVEGLPEGDWLYLDLESPRDRARLSDPETYLESQEGRLVILDEIHRVPELFPVLRSIVDRRRRRGFLTRQFLVLGSASLDLLRQSSESLAGRVRFLELTTIGIREINPDRNGIERLWVRGGFPDSLLARDDDASLTWRRAFILTYLERDIPQFGPRVPVETLRRFWTMLAHAQGQPLNAARLAAGLGVSGQTVSRYLDLLVDLLLVRRLAPWSGNVTKRLVRSPKVYVRDSGIVHALLDLRDLHDVLGHPVAGPSWEGMVIENLVNAAGDAPATFFRTTAGAEIDLVIEGRKGRRYAIEIKRSSAPTISRGFWSGCADIQAHGAIVAYPGTEAIPLGRDVMALGLPDALAWVADRTG